MAPGLQRVEALWSPHASIVGEAAQQKARLTAGLLLALALLSALTLFSPTLEAGSAWPPTDRWLVLGLLAVMAGAYLLTKAGHPKVALVAAIVAMEAGTWSSRWAIGVEGHGEPTLIFLALPVLLAGVLLPPRWAAAVAGGTVALAFVLESAIDQRLGRALDEEDVSLALLILGVGVLAVVSSTMAATQARRLEANAALLDQIASNIPEVFFVVSGDGKTVHYTSPAYERMTGRTVAQSLADPQDWLKSVHPHDLARTRKALEAGQQDLEYRILHPSGDIKHVRARTFPVLAAGKVDRIVGIAEDVSAQRQAQDAIEEAQRQRIQLLQQLAHDLASPLSPVKIQLRLLRDRLPEEAQPGMAIVQRNVDHIQRLIEDIKDVARLEGGQLNVRREPTDLAALARQAVETLSPAAAERQVGLVLDAPASLPGKADAGRITQVLYNLLGNALKFTPPGGHVELRLRALGGEAEVLVADSGMGMRPEQLAALFRPFSQVHDPGDVRRPEDKGSGLGLYISKGIVEAHGGTLTAASDGPGLGSTFTFRLPLDGLGPP